MPLLTSALRKLGQPCACDSLGNCSMVWPFGLVEQVAGARRVEELQQGALGRGLRSDVEVRVVLLPAARLGKMRAVAAHPPVLALLGAGDTPGQGALLHARSVDRVQEPREKCQSRPAQKRSWQPHSAFSLVHSRRSFPGRLSAEEAGRHFGLSVEESGEEPGGKVLVHRVKLDGAVRGRDDRRHFVGVVMKWGWARVRLAGFDWCACCREKHTLAAVGCCCCCCCCCCFRNRGGRVRGGQRSRRVRRGLFDANTALVDRQWRGSTRAWSMSE